jgi:ABC-type methionine transport system ATPase subunit
MFKARGGAGLTTVVALVLCLERSRKGNLKIDSSRIQLADGSVIRARYEGIVDIDLENGNI